MTPVLVGPAVNSTGDLCGSLEAFECAPRSRRLFPYCILLYTSDDATIWPAGGSSIDRDPHRSHDICSEVSTRFMERTQLRRFVSQRRQGYARLCDIIFKKIVVAPEQRLIVREASDEDLEVQSPAALP